MFRAQPNLPCPEQFSHIAYIELTSALSGGKMKSLHEKAKLTLLSSAVVMAVLLTASAAAADQALSANGSQWAIYEQTTLPNGNLNFYPAAHGNTFAMPDATSQTSPTFVNYMLNTYTASLTEANTITAEFTVTASSGAVLMGNPLWTAVYGSPTTPSYVRLFIQSNLASNSTAGCVGGSANVDNYWWAHGSGAYTFSTGSGAPLTVTLTATLDPSNWSGICGTMASSSVTAFYNSIANIKYVGLSFGSGYFFADGVGVDHNTGSATFQLTSYSIN